MLKYGNFMFRPEPSSSIILAINLLEIGRHLGCSVEWSEIENNMWINSAYDPCHDLGVLDFPRSIFVRLVFFVLTRTGVVNMTPKVLTFDKYLELECPVRMVIAIKANE